MRFKVKRGRHVEEDGLIYGPGQPAGDIVDTHLDLVKMFPEKFERVGGSRGEDDAQDDTTALVGTVVKDNPDTQKPDVSKLVERGPRTAKAGYPAKKPRTTPPADEPEPFFEDHEEEDDDLPPDHPLKKKKAAHGHGHKKHD